MKKKVEKRLTRGEKKEGGKDQYQENDQEQDDKIK